ncbi:MAG: NAD-dependent deacetylase [bacterium]
MSDNSAIEETASRLRSEPSITVLTGAGISAASGVPTFRGDDGLWDQFDPEELASPRGFKQDPEKVWEWYDQRRRDIDEVEPNRGHEVLGQWSRRYDKFSLVTQNVDDLHERADTRAVIHLHGNIWNVSCWENCSDSERQWENRQVPLPQIPPRCPHCDGLLRPEVVWFGEQLDPDVLEASQRALNCDLFFTIGTSAEVHPAAGFIDRASQQGAHTVEINPDSTSASQIVDTVIQQPAEEALDQIESLL